MPAVKANFNRIRISKGETIWFLPFGVDTPFQNPIPLGGSGVSNFIAPATPNPTGFAAPLLHYTRGEYDTLLR
jgi:hypothetical protein